MRIHIGRRGVGESAPIVVKSPKGHILLGIFLCAFVTIFAGIYFLSTNMFNNRHSGYLETIGTIVDSYEKYDYLNGEYEYCYAIAEYYVDGKRYTITSSDNSEGGYVSLGKEVTILYNPDNPNEAVFEKSDFSHWVAIAAMGLFGFIGVILIVVGVVKLIKEKWNNYNSSY